ncbi:MAG: hypothetical protein SWC40_07805 [Thermodesulfobacteriota bacterium]|nr:hypothetical protein [Thermodesulfobacteriota bacterium]
MISLNATLIVQVALFLGLLFVLNRLMIQPIHRLILEREQHLRDLRNQLQGFQEQLAQTSRDIQNRLKRAEQEAREAQVGMRRDANRQADEMMAAVQEQVVAFRQKVRQDVLQELEKARKQLRKQAESLSLEITTKVLGRRV